MSLRQTPYPQLTRPPASLATRKCADVGARIVPCGTSCPRSVARVTSEDSFVPLGDAAAAVLLSQQAIEAAGRALVR